MPRRNKLFDGRLEWPMVEKPRPLTYIPHSRMHFDREKTAKGKGENK